MGGDSIDTFVGFLAKRDGIDKLVKTFQYVSKLSHWRLENSNPDFASRAKKLEVQCGLSRKAFRTGRFLTGFNTLRTTHYPDWKIALLSILGNSGEMIYFLFDHFTFMSRVGFIDSKLTSKFCFISAFGEAFGYVFFIWLDLLLINRGITEEKKLIKKLNEKTKSRNELKSLLTLELHSKQLFLASENDFKDADSTVSTPSPPSSTSNSLTLRRKQTMNNADNEFLMHSQHNYNIEIQALEDEIKKLKSSISSIRFLRLMRVMGIFANVADLIIALAEIDPRPFYCHPLTLGISGLVSAWCGWFRVWPR